MNTPSQQAPNSDPVENSRHKKTGVGLILVGGQSRRMGRDKAGLRANDGETFLEKAIHRFDPICDQVWIGGGPATMPSRQRLRSSGRLLTSDGLLTSDRLLTSGRRMIDDDVSLGGAGPMRGILSALIVASRERRNGVLVSPVDVPLLTTDDFKLIVDSSLDITDRPIIAVSDRVEPLIGFYPVTMLGPMREAMGTGQRSLVRFLENQPFQSVALEKSACQNINTPAQFEQICSQRSP